MQWFNHLKIRGKLFSFLAIALLALVSLCYMAFAQMTKLGQIQDQGYVLAQQSDQATTTSFLSYRLYEIVADAITNRNLDETQRLWAEAKQNAYAELKTLNEMVDTDMERAEAAKANQAVNEFITLFETKMLPLLKSSNGVTGELLSLDAQFDSLKTRMKEPLAKIDASLNKDMADGDRAFDQNRRAATTLMIAFSLITAAVLTGISLFMIQTITKPINELVKVTEKIAEGDLDVEIHATTQDEIGQLCLGFDKMIANTNDVLTNINIAAEQVAAGSRQVSLSSQTLAQGSNEQASALEQISSSINLVATQTKQNAINSNQASDLAATIKDRAVEGDQQMKAMLKAMNEITESSANISKIIKVIDEIAFQTNILALNAAVEAARAGQYGKGFAVVAEEVRNLAARSASAAKETTNLIEGSINKVENGMKIANETADALNKIVGGVSKATGLITDIATATNQQASAIVQINQGIEQVSQVTQSNTATAEESSSASEELSSQAESLKNTVARFKIRKKHNMNQFQGASEDVLKALEMLTAQKDTAKLEATITRKPQSRINLVDSDLGKY